MRRRHFAIKQTREKNQMPRVANLKERQHQPIWDTLFRVSGSANPNISTRTTLFGNSNVGNFALTNLLVAGQLAADQTYIVLALRCYMYFNGVNRRTAYVQTASQLYFTFTLGDKPQFQAPSWYFPAGGGVWGFDSATSVFTNGVPSQDAILKLAKPIVIPVRQNISVTAEFFKVGSVDALTILNSSRDTTDESCVMFMLDGVRTRDVQ